MFGTNWRVQLLPVAGVVEGITALGLMIVPRVVVWLLFGADIDATVGSRSAWLIGTGLAVALMLMAGVAMPSMAEEGFTKDLGIIRACASDIWHLCPGVLPELVKACVQDKMCVDALLDAMGRRVI